MRYQAIEELLPATNGSLYKLIILASQRATEIAEGLPPLIGKVDSEKPTVIALEEILQGKVEMKKEKAKQKK